MHANDRLVLTVLMHICKALTSISYGDNKKYPAAQLSEALRLLEKALASKPSKAKEALDEIVDNERQLDTDYHPQGQQPAKPTTPAYQGQHITPAMAETMLEEAKQRQLQIREQRTKHRNEGPIQPENDLSDF